MSLRQQRARRNARKPNQGTPVRFPQLCVFVQSWTDDTHLQIGLTDVLANDIADLIVQQNPTLEMFHVPNLEMVTATLTRVGVSNVFDITLPAPINVGEAIILQPYAVAIRATRGAIIAPVIIIR